MHRGIEGQSCDGSNPSAVSGSPFDAQADKLIEFPETLVKDSGKNAFRILDTLRVHHSKPVKAWIEERRERTEPFYLPSHSTELNPEERLNADLKYVFESKRHRPGLRRR